ncbi:MAG TPA: hypothetical protein VK327_13875, partial [Candidatus Paceibacterota bacterium]|nr:hypothetical protein [Candidatus Paceibacterota bacterium]
GSNVVWAINHVATDSSDKPLTNVVVQTVVIRRIGSQAQNFDIRAQGLPVVTNLPLAIAKAGTNVSLTFSNRLNVENKFYDSTNLLNWSGGSLGFETASPLMSTLQLNAGLPGDFFRAAQVQYPPSLMVPRSIANRLITLNFSNGPSFVVTFNALGGGSYTNNVGYSGAVNYYAWKQDPYRGRLVPFWMAGYNVMGLHLAYATTNSGSFKGTVYLSYPSIPSGPVSGTFMSSP